MPVTNYVNVWGRSRVLVFASHDISWNVFRQNNFETFIFNANFQSSLEKPLSHKIIKSNTNLKPLSSWCQDNGSVSIFYWNWNTGCFMMWEMKGMKIIQTKDKLKPTHGLACTSRMRKTISPGQWQPWTAVSPLLGQKVCLIQLARTSPPSHWPKTSNNPFDYFKRYKTHTDCQLSFNGHLKRLTHPLQGHVEGLSNQLISLYKAYKTARLSIVRLRDNLLYITYTTTTTALFARL